MWHNEDTFPAGKVGNPPALFGDIAMTMDDQSIEKSIPFLPKKGSEAWCYFASEALRDLKLQKKAINYTLDKTRPVFQKVGSHVLDQLSSKVRRSPGKGFDIHSAIGKLPKSKRGWTLPGHNYTRPYNPLGKQVDYDPETDQTREVYQQVATEAIVDYAVCSNRQHEKSCEHNADRKMVKALDAVPWRQKKWGHAAARNAINLKQKLGLGM